MARSRRHVWNETRRHPLGWVRDHWRIAAESFHFISARPGTSFLVWLVVGIALALPSGLRLLQVNMDEMTAEWEGRPGLSVYFELDAAAAEIDTVRQSLAEDALIMTVAVISAEAALDEFKTLSGLGDALDLLDANPLPASLKATFTRNVTADELAALTAPIADREGVAEVVVEKTWLERLNDMSEVVSRLGWVLAALFGVGAVLVTASSVRLAIEARLEELRVLKLVGATSGQLRRPFLYFGAIYGFGGGMVAAMLLALTLVVIEPPLRSLLGSYQRTLEFAGFDPWFFAALLGVGSALGIAGALLAVRQRLSNLEIV